jgi:hypothetical protein
MRRLQAHAFSEKALSGQEPIIKHYVDLLTLQLHQQAERPNGSVVDMVRWYNFTTFDIIGDLALGQPFGCLRDGILHPWIEMVFAMIKSNTFIRSARRFPSPLKEIFWKFIPQNLIRMREDQFQFSALRAKQRMAEGTEREDFSKQPLSHTLLLHHSCAYHNKSCHDRIHSAVEIQRLPSLEITLATLFDSSSVAGIFTQS